MVLIYIEFELVPTVDFLWSVCLRWLRHPVLDKTTDEIAMEVRSREPKDTECGGICESDAVKGTCTYVTNQR